MELKVSGDVVAQLEHLKELCEKTPKRAHAEAIGESEGYLNDVVEEVQSFLDQCDEINSQIGELVSEYETWADETEDRDLRRDARDNIESIQQELVGLLDDVLAQIEAE